MNITEITPDYSVAGQIARADVKEIAARGFRSIMCNRPDHESPGQTEVAEIRAAAEAEGLAFAFVPVVSGDIRPDDVTEFRASIGALPAPVLAYCRSGARCQNIWQMAQ